MPRPWTGYLAGTAFVLYAVTGAAAFAQGVPAPAVPPAVDGGHRMDPADQMARHEERRILIEEGHRHLDMMGGGPHGDMAEHLRTMLQLKPGQEGALQAFVAAVKPPQDHEHMMQMADHDEHARTTLERLAEMEKHMAEHQAQAHARIEATRRFYNQLEPSQKKVFDEMPMLMMGHMGPMMGPGPMKVRFENPPMHAMPPAPRP